MNGSTREAGYTAGVIQPPQRFDNGRIGLTWGFWATRTGNGTSGTDGFQGIMSDRSLLRINRRQPVRLDCPWDTTVVNFPPAIEYRELVVPSDMHHIEEEENDDDTDPTRL